MILNFLRLSSRNLEETDHAVFVERVSVQRRLRPVDGFVVIGWALILTKCVLATFAIHRWSIPIHDFYVWGPSLIFGALCTWLYLSHEDDEE